MSRRAHQPAQSAPPSQGDVVLRAVVHVAAPHRTCLKTTLVSTPACQVAHPVAALLSESKTLGDFVTCHRVHEVQNHTVPQWEAVDRTPKVRVGCDLARLRRDLDRRCWRGLNSRRRQRCHRANFRLWAAARPATCIDEQGQPHQQVATAVKRRWSSTLQVRDSFR